jgi:hypothetical protein
MCALRACFIFSLIFAGSLPVLIPPVAHAQYIYSIEFNGVLEWREHLGSTDGSASWAGPVESGFVWQNFRAVFPGGNGIIYAVTNGGALLWYRHCGFHDGSDNWSSAQVGAGWQYFETVFSGGDGIIYGLQSDGVLVWYKHLGWKVGTDSWEGPRVVATGFSYASVFAGDGGSVYGIRSDGTLVWRRHVDRETGGPGWDGPTSVGSSWGNYRNVFAGANGVVYALRSDGRLFWNRHRGYLDGANSWQGPVVVSTHWPTTRQVFGQIAAIEGYCWPQSGAPGDSISFHVSSPSDYQVTFVRFRRVGDQNEAIPVSASHSETARLARVPAEPWRNGCRWEASFHLEIPQDWASGMYAAACTDPTGRTFHIVFIVKPRPGDRGDFAVIANTNTWNAYNDWGGASKYDLPADALSFLRPNPQTAPIDDGGVNRRTRAELWVLDWLVSTGYRFDVYSDTDLHRGIPALSEYRGLVMDTHPEYWSLQMRDNLEAYLAGGGSLLYLAGNGMFEQSTLSFDGGTESFFPGGQFPRREPSYFRNLDPPRPERNLLGVAFRYENYFDFAPYRVLQAGHHLFAGTGIANGQTIGSSGLNGGASGWEMDTSIPGNAPDGVIVTCWGDDDRGIPPANLELLARGTNVGTGGEYGADMTYYTTPAGGFVFSVGSISFGGSLVVDPVLQQIVKNALAEAYGTPSAVDAGGATPALALRPNEPNPFEAGTTIRYEIPVRSRVRLAVYDVQGRELTGLVDGVQSAGAHAVTWGGRLRSGMRAGAGLYLYKLDAVGVDGGGGWMGSGR